MNMKSHFEYHEVKWNGEKVDRVWNYFTKIQKNQTKWFADLMSSGIYNYLRKQGIKFSNKKLLDYGAGKGYLMDVISMNEKTSALDCGEFSEEGLSFLKNKYENSSIQVVNLSSTPSVIDSNKYDLVFLIEVVEHLDDDYLEKTISEVYRILKPGGKVIITTPFNENLEANNVCCPDCGAIFHRVQHVRSWSIESIITAFNVFKPYHVSNTNFFLFKSDLSLSLRILNLIRRSLGYKYTKRNHLIFVGSKS